MGFVAIPRIFSSITGYRSCENPKTPCSAQSFKVLMSLNHVSDSSTSWPKSISHGRRRFCECFDLHKELVPYGEALSWQKSLVQDKKDLVEKNEECYDSLIILQHPSVYTLGTGSSEEHLKFEINNAPHDVFRTERGGEVTYHGPGQLVMYPIVNLRNHKMDLHWYLRALEEVVIRLLRLTFSIKASRLEGLTGVWVGNQKVAAIGIRVSQWITYHGLALNVTTDLTPFQHIVPCGIKDRQVGSIQGSIGEFGSSCGQEADKSRLELLDIAHRALLEAFSDVFQLELFQKPTCNLGFQRKDHNPNLWDETARQQQQIKP